MRGSFSLCQLSHVISSRKRLIVFHTWNTRSSIAVLGNKSQNNKQREPEGKKEGRGYQGLRYKHTKKGREREIERERERWSGKRKKK